MTVQQLKAAVLALSPEEKKAFIVETLPTLSRDALQDPAFMMQLFPIFLQIVRDSGLELSQLVQFASMFGGQPAATGRGRGA
jgi:hypothetical protein